MMRKLFSILFNMTLILVILVSMLYIVSTAETMSNPQHIPSVLGLSPLTVVSGSMSPGIETGDMVVIRKGSQDIKPGDVVTYRLENILVTHRVVDISEQEAVEVFVTKGDANSVSDYKAVDRNQIVGKYLFRIPMGGYIKASLQGWPGMLILLGLALIAFMSKLLVMTTAKVRQVEQSMGPI